MNQFDAIIKALSEKYRPIVKSPHCIQIKLKEGRHNIWLTAKGAITFMPHGQQSGHSVTLEQLLKELEHYDYESTDLAAMSRLSYIMGRIDLNRTGIYCDAGFAEGRARAAIIRVHGGDFDIAVRHIHAESSFAAEEWAIKEAIRMYPGDEPVFSDCLAAVEGNKPRAEWIARESNAEADQFGNVRKKK